MPLPHRYLSTSAIVNDVRDLSALIRAYYSGLHTEDTSLTESLHQLAWKIFSRLTAYYLRFAETTQERPSMEFILEETIDFLWQTSWILDHEAERAQILLKIEIPGLRLGKEEREELTNTLNNCSGDECRLANVIEQLEELKSQVLGEEQEEREASPEPEPEPRPDTPPSPLTLAAAYSAANALRAALDWPLLARLSENRIFQSETASSSSSSSSPSSPASVSPGHATTYNDAFPYHRDEDWASSRPPTPRPQPHIPDTPKWYPKPRPDSPYPNDPPPPEPAPEDTPVPRPLSDDSPDPEPPQPTQSPSSGSTKGVAVCAPVSRAELLRLGLDSARRRASSDSFESEESSDNELHILSKREFRKLMRDIAPLRH